MKLIKRILLIMLIVGFIFEGAVVYAPVVATANTEDVYDAFWDILNREAELVVVLNETGNKSVAMELIENSRIGSQNAVNISVLVWKALEELRESGMKMYYSSEELGEMAQNISENGLPNETVQYLKSQGWTDEEISELEEYIAKNADNITSGFNMSAFLQNFSLAFVRVGFKYTYYESWGFYKAFWEGNEQNVTTPANHTRMINPLLSREWVNLYSAYTSGNVEEALSSAGALSSKIESLISSRTGIWNSQTLTAGSDGSFSLLTINRNVTSITYIQNDGLLVSSFYITSSSGTLVGNSENYYWWKALDAYRTLREILVILEAMEGGVSDPDLQYMLNQRMAQLKDELLVDCVKTSKQLNFVKPDPKPVPIPKPPGSIGIRSSSTVDRTSSTSARDATPIEVLALYPDSNYGYIDDLQVTLEKSVLADGRIGYHLHVSFAVEKNALSDVTIKLSDSWGSDSVSYSTLPIGSQSWDSRSFTTSDKILNPGDSVTISGTVTITYTSTDTPTPTSENLGFEIAGGPKKAQISTSYSFTITYDDLMQEGGVHIQVIPEPSSSITQGQSVTFQLVITNNNQVPIYGHWEASVEIPSEGSEVPKTNYFSDDVTVYPGDTQTVTMTTVTYESAGDYKYSVTFSFGGSNSKTVSGVIHVSSDSGSAGSLAIKNVTPSPSSPKSGDMVNFTVKVRNSYLTKKEVKVMLFIDGNFVDSTEGSIPSTSDMTFTLHWLAESGQHSYEVKLYSVDENGVKTLVDPWSGDLNVARDPDGLYAWLEVVPDKLKPGDSAVAFITLENTANYSQTWPVELVDNTGNVWWPRPDDYVLGTNYTLSEGAITIGSHRTAHIMVADIELYQNTTFYLKVGGITMAMAYVEVNGSSPIVMKDSFCKNPYFDYENGAYRATLVCEVEFKNIASAPVEVKKVAVGSYMVTGALEDTVSGSWSAIPSEFTINPHSTTEVRFNIPLTISTWVPISVADATKLVFKNGEYGMVSFTYTFGYRVGDENSWSFYSGMVVHTVKVTMDAKTVAADYILSGGMAYVSAWTLLKAPSGFKVKIKGVEFNPVGVFLGVVLYYGKDKALETLANWWGRGI